MGKLMTLKLMTLRDFRIGWRTLAREPVYSLVAVLGLGIGFAACLLLLGFVRYSWQYNSHVPGVENVYVVKQRFNVDPKAPWFDQAPLLLRLAAAKTPGVAAATGYVASRPLNNELTVRLDGQLRQLHSLTVLPGFADMLGLEVLQGDVRAALERPESVAITEEAALRFFGSVRVLGRTVQVEGKQVRVDAVLRTLPATTTIPFEMILGAGSVLMDGGFRDELTSGSTGWWGKLLVRVDPGASLPAVTQALQQAVDHAPSIQDIQPEVKARLGERKVMDIALSPLRYAYFDQDVAGNHISAPGERGNPVVVAGLGVIAVLILVLAAVNYINLATVRVLQRQREVALRKLLGAGARQIAFQFLAESLLVALTATALGLLMAWAALPVFSRLMDRQLESMLSPGNVGAALALGCLLGVLTAAYPAWIALRVRPAHALAGRSGTESMRGMQLRRAMTVFQVAAALGLASVSLAVAWQTQFAMHASPGFDAAPLLVVDLPDAVRQSGRARGFVAALSSQPGISGVAVSEDAIGRLNTAWVRTLTRPGGQSASMDMKSVSANFFEQYRIRPVVGRLFDPKLDQEDDPVPLVVNAVAAMELGFSPAASAVGQTVLFTGFDGKVIHKRVVGIAPELRFHSLHEAPRATAYELWTAGTTLSVRSEGQPVQAERIIGALWARHYPDAVLKLHRAGDILAENYAEEARVARILSVATGIAMALAAFGTYALCAHTVQRRAREIVLRKLHGARRADIALLVLRETGIQVAVAAVIALPLAAIAIQRYLATYVERAPVGAWTVLFALALTMTVALAAVARHTWTAMRMMPADALRG
jgi:putative ABC transport system permease protein